MQNVQSHKQPKKNHDNSQNYFLDNYTNNLQIGHLYQGESKIEFSEIDTFKTKKYKLGECIKCLAFNLDESLLFCSMSSHIYIFNSLNGQLNEYKILTEHTSQVQCILFSKKINWFVSGGFDSQIICWKLDSKNKWVSNKYKLHKKYVQCLLLNKNEDCLFSGSYDQSIKVWKIDQIQNQLIYLYDLENGHTQCVNQISMNFREDIIVSTGDDFQIKMWNKQANGEWKYLYAQQQSNYGYRICFISDDQFAWQIYNKGVIQFFQIEGDKFRNMTKLLLQLNKSEKDSNLFPMIYNKEKQILINKYGKYVYFIKKQLNGRLVILDQINCNHHANYGQISNKLNYFVNWDYQLQEIKLLKTNYQ